MQILSCIRRITNLTPHSTSILLERKTKKPTPTVFSRESLLYTTTNSIQYYPQYVYDFKKIIPRRFLAAGIAKAALGMTFGIWICPVISKLCLRFKVSQKSLGFSRAPKGSLRVSNDSLGLFRIPYCSLVYFRVPYFPAALD